MRRWALPLLAFTLVEISAPWLLLGHAETRIDSSTTGLLISMVPLIAAIIVTRLGHDRLDARRIVGLAIGFAGVATLVGLDIHLSDLPAAAALFLASTGYAVGPIIIDRKLRDVPPMGVVAGSLAIATLLYAPFVPALWPAYATPAAVGSIAMLGVLCTAIAFVLFFALIADVGPARATVIAYVNPLVAALLGVLVLREPMTLGMAIGFPLVIVGSVLATRSRAAQ